MLLTKHFYYFAPLRRWVTMRLVAPLPNCLGLLALKALPLSLPNCAAALGLLPVVVFLSIV